MNETGAAASTIERYSGEEDKGEGKSLNGIGRPECGSLLGVFFRRAEAPWDGMGKIQDGFSDRAALA